MSTPAASRGTKKSEPKQRKLEEPSPKVKTEKELRDEKLKTKFHAWLYSAIVRIEKNGTAGENEKMFVTDGKARLKISLKQIATKDLLTRLTALGFVVSKSDGMELIGTLPIEKFALLVDIEEIVLILPH